MSYPYKNFTGYHRDRPDRKVSVEGFGKRGAAIKIRKILSSMGVMDRKEDWANIMVIEGT